MQIRLVGVDSGKVRGFASEYVATGLILINAQGYKHYADYYSPINIIISGNHQSSESKSYSRSSPALPWRSGPAPWRYPPASPRSSARGLWEGQGWLPCSPRPRYDPEELQDAPTCPVMLPGPPASSTDPAVLTFVDLECPVQDGSSLVGLSRPASEIAGRSSPWTSWTSSTLTREGAGALEGSGKIRAAPALGVAPPGQRQLTQAPLLLDLTDQKPPSASLMAALITLSIPRQCLGGQIGGRLLERLGLCLGLLGGH